MSDHPSQPAPSPHEGQAAPAAAREAQAGRGRAWARGLAVAALLGSCALGLGWLHPRSRHALLLALTGLERRWSAGQASPPSGAPASTAAHWVHAGWVGDAPANSGPSVRAACASYRGVEVDVAFSTDLVPYISHDHDFERISGVAGDRLSRHSAAEIDALRGPEDEAALRLAALASAACEVLVLDVKTDHAQATAKADSLLRALGSRREGVWVLSMSGPFLQALGSEAPQLRLGCEGYLPLGNALAGFHVSSLERRAITSARDASARARGLLRLYWTARDAAQQRELRAWSPDALLFDAPRIPPEALPKGTRRGEEGS